MIIRCVSLWYRYQRLHPGVLAQLYKNAPKYESPALLFMLLCVVINGINPGVISYATFITVCLATLA